MIEELKRLLSWLSRRRFPYEPLITILLSKNNLLHNLNEFRKLAPKGTVAPVLKSNAYGNGLFDIARMLEDEHRRLKQIHQEYKLPFFCVDSYFEAVALRSQNIRTPILIIGYTRPETILASKLHKVSFTISSLDQLKRIKDASRDVFIQIKIDTGMRRQGILTAEIDEAISIIENNLYLMVEGVLTHFADADNVDPSFTEAQISTWNKVTMRFRHTFPNLKFVHSSNTDGHRFSRETEDNVSRLGLGLYGIADGSAFSPPLNLLPVLEMKTIVTGVKKISRGDTVGYGRTFRADKDMRIAIIPVGYYEGVDRRLSNKGSFLVGPERVACPIVGRVSMNITTIDISKMDEVDINTPVVVISGNRSDPNSIFNMAKLCGMLSYEIAVFIPPHLKRVTV